MTMLYHVCVHPIIWPLTVSLTSTPTRPSADDSDPDTQVLLQILKHVKTYSILQERLCICFFSCMEYSFPTCLHGSSLMSFSLDPSLSSRSSRQPSPLAKSPSNSFMLPFLSTACLLTWTCHWLTVYLFTLLHESITTSWGFQYL